MELKDTKIQEVIKPGQVVLIQVIKEERGAKRSGSDNFYFFGWKIYCPNAKYTKGRRYFKKIFNSSDRQKIRLSLAKSIFLKVWCYCQNSRRKQIKKRN